MPGPLSAFCPLFPEDFVVEARATVRRKTAPQQLVQRCRLVLLLHEDPQLGQEEAGRQVGLSGRQVLRWRQRWAAGDFSVADTPGRGRKAMVSPPGPGAGQGHRLWVGGPDQAALEPSIPGRCHGSGPGGFGPWGSS